MVSTILNKTYAVLNGEGGVVCCDMVSVTCVQFMQIIQRFRNSVVV